GVGMSALAIVAKGMGYRVTGSDVDEEFITDNSLKKAGIKSYKGFNGSHLNPAVDLVVIGAAYGQDNPEVLKAKEQDIPFWFYSELLGYLTAKKKTIAV